MSKPQHKPYSITVFIVEGIKVAAVVTTVGEKMTQRNKSFSGPYAALAWCRKNRAGLVYSPGETTAVN